MENQKRKAKESGRFEQLLKKVKALKEDSILSIKEPDGMGETYETQQGDDAADIVADDENKVSQNEDGTGTYLDVPQRTIHLTGHAIPDHLLVIQSTCFPQMTTKKIGPKVLRLKVRKQRSLN